MIVTCENCQKRFETADRVSALNAQGGAGNEAQMKYCSEKCARQAENRRAYQKNRSKILAKAKAKKSTN